MPTCGTFLSLTLLAHPAILVAGEVAAVDDQDRLVVEKLRSYPHRIVHETYRENNWELYLRNADGTQPRNLTRTPEIHEMYPQCSRDGSRICFVADEALDGKTVRSVYFMNADGSSRRLVARNARQPCWSPDGRVIAYLKSEFPKFTVTDFATKGLFFYDVATGNHRQHANDKIHHLYNICWAPNGRWILATVHGGMGYGHAILAIEVAGRGVYDLKIGGCRPDLSPDGKRVCWGKDDHTIAVADIDLESSVPRVSEVRELVKDELHVYHSDWSPDGEFISFSRGPGGRVRPDGPGTHRGIAEIVGVRAKWDLCVMPVSGESGLVQLTNDGESNKESEWITARPAGTAVE